MKQTRSLMGMHITINVVDKTVTQQQINEIFTYFDHIDKRFSPYKKTSEVTKINAKQLSPDEYSSEMKEVLSLCEQTKQETDGYFDVYKEGRLDPSGLVKGWAIWHAAKKLDNMGLRNYFIDAGGDVQVAGSNENGNFWTVGIQNPFHKEQIVKIVTLTTEGIATSGTAIRGQHIYDPHRPYGAISDIVSITVIGKNVYEADRFATAAFAMGANGISFIERLPGFEGYMINTHGIASYTSGFLRYTQDRKDYTYSALEKKSRFYS